MTLDLSKLKDGTPLLITFDDWFLARDGNSYKYAWGKCFVRKGRDVLGFEPRGGSNWLMQIGEGEGALFVMGCKIHFAQVCTNRPHKNANMLFVGDDA